MSVPAHGTVRSFDDDAGLGVVVADDGTEYALHCTAIADGSRSIVAGTPVRFTVVPGRQGRWEAAAVEARSTATT